MTGVYQKNEAALSAGQELQSNLETGMRAAHDLKRGPVELDRLQPGRDERQVLSRSSGVVRSKRPENSCRSNTA